MANLKTTMDAGFWDLNIATSRAIDGISRAVPGDPVPLDGARASKMFRIQQLSFLRNGFPLGIIPSYSPSPNHKELGSFSLQSLLWTFDAGNWWTGLVGQFRPKKLISSIKAEILAAEEWDPSLIRDVARHFLDLPLYAGGLWSHFSLSSSTSLIVSAQGHGDRKRPCAKSTILHRLPDHDITLEAAWPELFIDRKGKYWEVPEYVSLDCTSIISESGLRYRVGIHENRGIPEGLDSDNGEVPPSLLPGICMKAAVCYERSRDLQKALEKKEDVSDEKEKQEYSPSPYDIRLKEPHSTISGIIGGNCEAWLLNKKALNRSTFAADLFGTLCYTFQHGNFTKDFGDLTRFDARLDIASASSLVKTMVSKLRKNSKIATTLSSPSLGLIFQQQIAGPIVARVDSKIALSDSSGRLGLELEDLKLSLCYSMRLLKSGKVVGWYSPIRKEGMIELKIFEF